MPPSPPPPSPPSLPTMGLVYPLYVYPDTVAVEGVFAEVAAAASSAEVVVIVNPGNGDEATCPPPSTWQAAIDLLKGKGARTIGYVHSDWGNRSIDDYLWQIDTYFDCWGVEGIFVDEASTDPRDLGTYDQVFRYVKGAGPPGAPVWLNPGTPTHESYAAVADVLVQFESTLGKFED